MPELIGSLKNIVYHNKDNDFYIVKITTEEDTVTTVTGYFPELNEGVTYQFEGDFSTHPKYGYQFKATHVIKRTETSKAGLVSYFSSPLFSGIGPKTAEKIVEVCGEDAIEMILKEPNVLKKVGLSPIRIVKFVSEIKQQRHQETILVTLYGYGISSRMAMKIITYYGNQTLERLQQNPYQLANDLDQVGFIKADMIAKQMGIEDSDERRIEAGLIFTFEQRGFNRGDTYLTLEQIESFMERDLYVDVAIMPILEKLIASFKVREVNGKYALSSSYVAEEKVSKKLLSLISNEHQQKIDVDLKTIEFIESLKTIEYTDMQKEAIIEALNHSVTIITGGPGTGKTTIIDGIIDTYLHIHQLSKQDHEISEHILLMAPTGRAAKRMREVLNMPAKTIHSALGYNFDNTFNYHQLNPLPHKLIIIDEASMIDIFLAQKCFDAILDDAKLIIVGDVDQLPSVGPGQLLEDLIQSNVCKVVRLTQIHRQALSSNIIRLSQKVNQMEVSEYDLKTEDDVYVYACYPQQMIPIILKQISGAISKGYDMYADIQVLIPLYKGDVGIDMFNKAIQSHVNDMTTKGVSFGDKTYYKHDKVIQLVNDPKSGVMNGDMGKIVSISEVNNQTIITIDFDGYRVEYEKADLDQINLAYAISIHKSQGSEYKMVIMPLSRSYLHMFKKELIYTAMTRAKSMLLLIGDSSLLMYAANHQSEKRQTLLNQFFSQELKEENTLSPYDFM